MDLNGDGHLDVTSGSYNPGTITFFAGTEDGFAAGRPLEEVVPEPEKAPDGTPPQQIRPDMSRWMSTANFVDWDGDGDLDMVVGNVLGAVYLNLNKGTRTRFEFGARVPLETDAGPIKVVQKSDPWPVDWDGDGVLDLLVGDEAADVTFFRGRKDGKFDAGVSLWTGTPVPAGERYADAAGRLKGKAKVPGFRVRLATCDWNGDGKLDLLVGNCVKGEPPAAAPDEPPPRAPTIGHVYLFLRR